MSVPNLDLSPYQFQRIIGIGSTSTVALYTQNEISYAIKLIPAINLSTLIRNEVDILARLNDFNFPIPKLYTHGLLNSKQLPPEIDSSKLMYGLVMEYIDGITLEEIDLDDTSMFDLATWLFTLLRNLHALNIVHRDIKPDNIIFNPASKQFHLIDFGLIGNPYYLAPEGWSGFIDYIHEYKAMDVWATGVMLFNLNYGDYPFTLTADEIRKYDRKQKLDLLRQRIQKDSLSIKYDTLFPIISMALTKDILERPSAEKLYQVII